DAESNNGASVHAVSAGAVYADLRVELFALPASVLAGDTLTVDWRVTNHGPLDTSATWNDQLVITRDALVGNADDIVVGNLGHAGGLRSGESYTHSTSISLPPLAPGRYFLGVRADSGDNVIELDSRNDNATATGFELLAAAADLTVEQITVPATARGGETIRVGWLVRNDGETTSDLALWNDRIVLSLDAIADAGDLIVAAAVTHAGVLQPGQSYLAEADVTLPAVLAGDYFAIVIADAEGRLSESGRRANNSAASQARLRIDPAAAADLAVDDVFGPTAVQPGEGGTVSYITRNLGTLDATTPWQDRIYLDQGSAGLLEVASVRNAAPLTAGGSTARSLQFTVPASAVEGDFRWLVMVDADDAIAEPVANNNRAVSAASVRVARSDLAIERVDYPGRVQSGSPMHVEWSVRNDGAVARGSWTDRVYLIGKGLQQELAEIVHSGPLAAGASYDASADLQVPIDSIGAYQLLVVTDADLALADRSRANNQLQALLTIDLAPHVDLVVDGLTLTPDGPLQPGQSVSASWLTRNLGNSPVREAWSERLELRNLDTGSIVTTIDLPGGATLAAGASRSGTALFLWPQGVAAAGRFSLQVTVDAASQLAEANPGGTAESNNTAEIFRVTGPDLLVRKLRVEPAGATPIAAGGVLKVFWDDANEGDSATDAVLMESIKVSNLDTGQLILDAELAFDPLASVGGTPGRPLQAGESRQRRFDFTLPEGLRGSGRIEISVTVDRNRAGVGSVFETNGSGNAENNNRASVEITSAARAYPDLRVGALSVPASVVGGEFAEIRWSVDNHGSVDGGGSWTDQIIFSSDALIGNADDLIVGSARHQGGLHVGESYTQQLSVPLPLAAAGRYTLAVRTDSAGEAEPDPGADNVESSTGVDLLAPIVDLALIAVNAPTGARSGDELTIAWEVLNVGNATTRQAQWNDRILLSSHATPSSDDLILAGSLAHHGALAPGLGYRGQATLQLPRDLAGDFFVVVETNRDRRVGESGLTANNTLASTTPLAISLTPTADLTVGDVLGPAALRPGDPATVSYLLTNAGAAPTTSAWRDRIYLEDASGALHELASVFNTTALAAAASVRRSANLTLPSSLPEGQWRWLVRTDSDDSIYERGAESNNQSRAVQPLQVARTDLSLAAIKTAATASSGAALHVEWQVSNQGGVALGNWTDEVFLARAGVLHKFAELTHSGPLASGESYDASAELAIPLDYAGDYELIVVSDSGNALDDGDRHNNRSLATVTIDLAPYADLLVGAISASDTLIADPATLTVAWTVSNQGTGAGLFSSWTDRVLLSRDDIAGNADDQLLGEYRHSGALASGESYSRSEQIVLAARTSGRFRLFVVGDARDEVFENHSEANNVGRLAHTVDVMPVPYADLRITSLGTEGAPASGRPLSLTWEVVNDGIGSTDSGEWSDQIWLSRNADGSDVVAQLGQARHIGQLAVGDRYSRRVELTLPEGIDGTHYLNVRTGGPFEFVFADNNSASSPALPVQLSRSPDLRVETVTAPVSAQEGALVDVSWTVVNQGDADAVGIWVDSIWLVPASGSGSAIALGSFSNDRGLAAGMRYTRSEQLRLPQKIEGVYRLKVISNSNLGSAGEQVYEHGAARQNNAEVAAATTTIGLDERPDLRVTAAIVAEHVSAGTATAIRYTIANLGAAVASGHWTDRIYLSLDATLSADDRLLGEVANAGALAPGESYASDSAPLDIPIRSRGDAYLIVVADGNFKVDEYPNEANNALATRFTVDPVAFADLVTSQVVAPDQGVHGASIEVRYQVTNHGSQTTRGESAALDRWTDTIWLARDRRRPAAHKGDILLGSFTHVGQLAVGESYLGDVRVTLPDALASGEYFVTVWSDSYDVILEDTLATQINPDDPSQVDNNNYQARPI
ncbi:MAG: hypothetical protein KDI53_18655, partial [Candidatus Accumulibacter sp.]|nr:hypothetical protein [Accumulibacter sp.]